MTILAITVFEKFTEGGWLTLVITSFLILLCYMIRTHYGRIRGDMRKLDELLKDVPTRAGSTRSRLIKRT